MQQLLVLIETNRIRGQVGLRRYIADLQKSVH
jgi:hypothetical protein